MGGWWISIMKKNFLVLCVAICCVLVIFIVYIKTKNNKYIINGASYITEQNRHLIGTQAGTGDGKIEENNEHYTLKTNHIIKSIDPEMRLDSALISEFTVKEENTVCTTPEIIGTNGSISVFTKEDGSGWMLNKGQVLTLNFNKYNSKVIEHQTVIIGYVLNGKMVSGKNFSELSGSYKITADESGEYYIYIVNASSDYVAFKEGSITIS